MTISTTERPGRVSQRMPHAMDTATLGDILERILDKGVVISGDIKVKLVDIELLTVQIRLLICSVDKAREMGINWWASNPYLNPTEATEKDRQLEQLQHRIQELEAALAQSPPVAADPNPVKGGGTPHDPQTG
ncbi:MULTISPECIES: gas vesicle protein [Ectothiorhodospira]|uniref:gas vesicle protein n=1 Tax=Ectothiorhodospira TaxID=1051 RepID=UPI001EE8BD0E|nr:MULTISPECIES: gas vesicle protein [Ectothiorhodospira]MCG5495764.1 gas vesicle protein [Ectothiorhodospira variabilis]MCG5498549.1 gas vesicle protein [Ectothiorhodospira variabilis]MCG5505209.1 gas vesicle protein [Ectothiorhodospira variabilis]MCG5508354.1 gas vesicle protein [Ectothiorhodospira variabilis]MCG5526134.1 gas vesicle protein [Ectothiorhodospira haloalkaliphila]